MTSRYPRACFAVLLLLWQLAAGSLAHAAPATDPADCGHEQAVPEQTAPDTRLPADGQGTACDMTQCNCPCGHTPALRLDPGLNRASASPVERRIPVDEAVPPGPGEELFRPPG